MDLEAVAEAAAENAPELLVAAVVGCVVSKRTVEDARIAVGVRPDERVAVTHFALRIAWKKARKKGATAVRSLLSRHSAASPPQTRRASRGH